MTNNSSRAKSRFSKISCNNDQINDSQMILNDTMNSTNTGEEDSKFIFSSRNTNNQNEIISNGSKSNNDERTSIKTYDSELQGEILRLNYYNKLQKVGLWDHPMRKSNNSIIIFDWDDTLMFSTEYFNFLNKEKFKRLTKKLNKNSSNDNIYTNNKKKKSQKDLQKSSSHSNIELIRSSKNSKNFNSDTQSKKTINQSQPENTFDILNMSFINDIKNDKVDPVYKLFLEEFNYEKFESSNLKKLKLIASIKEKVANILSKAKNMGDVFLVTNATLYWVEFTSKLFFNDVYEKYFPNIKIISARDQFCDNYKTKEWKKKCFTKVSKTYNKSILTNIMVIGDSNYEIDAADILFKKFKFFKSTFFKTIKFKEKPTYEVLNKQLELVDSSFERIFNNNKNMNILVNQKN